MISFLYIRPYFLIKVKLLETIQLSNKEGSMRTNKPLIVCLAVCLILYSVAAVYAAPYERWSTPVTIVNNNSKPIPVTEVTKYQVQKEIVAEFLPILWKVKATLYTVPLNKRLVIEYFSCSSLGSYSTAYSCFVKTGTGPDAVYHYLPTTPYGHDHFQTPDDGIDPVPISNPLTYMTAGQRVQVYAEPGTEVETGAYRQNQAIKSISDNPAESMAFSFSGYLVDIAP